ncbi:MAG: hypothetical protein P1P93_08845 [Gammaproteobacteria bacterium]|nr:hypothetical protein [Gammaproteobacteria bacterium]
MLTTLIKLLSVITVVIFATTACDSNDGSMEKAGEKIDKATTDFGNKVEDACEDLKEGLNAKDPNC